MRYAAPMREDWDNHWPMYVLVAWVVVYVLLI